MYIFFSILSFFLSLYTRHKSIHKLLIWFSLLQVIIDIEWGAFGDNGVLDFIKTDFDRENDANSLIVNSFT